MTPPLRRGGSGTQPDGTRVTWTVAEGRRGRRWREVRIGPDGGIRSSLLLETDPDGWFSHLELATPAGLLTLHPEGDGTLHGNTVRPTGIEHLRGLPWTAETVIVIADSPVSMAAAATVGRRAPDGAVGAVVVGEGLDLEAAAIDGADLLAAIDATGLPRLAEATDWPLEEA